MKRAKTIILISLVTLVALFTLLTPGCTYSDSKIYYATPVPGDSARVVVFTNLDDIDTTVIVDSLMFKYEAEIEGGELYFLEASISNILLYQNLPDYNPDTITGPYILVDSFWIPGEVVAETGLSSLLFSLYYSSNTNSLADKVHVEADILNLDFDLMMEGGAK
jgi:hypothetical protein